MKHVLLLTLVTFASVAAQAAPSPDATCRVRMNGQETGMYSDEDQFFSDVANASRGGRCTYGKIFHLAGSGRVYSNGRLVADPATGKVRGLTNAEAARAKREAGGGCTEYSCDEAGVIRGNEDIGNELPPADIVIPVGEGW